MSLTAAQLQTLKTSIAANSATVLVNGTPTAISAVPVSPDNAAAVAAWYNLTAAPNFFAYYANVPVAQVKGAVQWKRLTPTDAPDGTQAWANRSLACQGAQFNLQLLMTSFAVGVGGVPVIDATPNRVVQGFSDCLSAVPSGAAGATQDAGWAVTNGVRTVLNRKATNAEKLFADASNGAGDTNATAAALTFEGSLTAADVLAAWNS